MHKQRSKKEEEIAQNTRLREKMESIQAEVVRFSENIDKFAAICDDELEELLANIDKVTHSIH